MRSLMLIAAVFVAGCQKESSACDYLNRGYQPLKGGITSLPSYPLEQVPDRVVREIQKCWAAKPYGGPQHSIRLRDARKVSSTRYYLLFEPWGITDTRLVFLVDRELGVLEGYKHSMW